MVNVQLGFYDRIVRGETRLEIFHMITFFCEKKRIILRNLGIGFRNLSRVRILCRNWLVFVTEEEILFLDKSVVTDREYARVKLDF